MSNDNFLMHIREMIPILRYSIRTEESYVMEIRRFILFNHKCHPQDGK